MDRKYITALVSSIVLFAVSIIVNYYAGMYATTSASNSVGDIVLDNIRVYDVDMIFIYGPVIMWIFVAALCVLKPQRIPFILKAIALFILTRSLFIILTHLGPYPYRLDIDYTSRALQDFTFGGDLFFSGHTGLPFLMALIFADNRELKYLFTGTAVLFGTVVLMAHRHYTIDVLAAFYITFAIFHMAKYFFASDLHYFKNGFRTNYLINAKQ